MMKPFSLESASSVRFGDIYDLGFRLFNNIRLTFPEDVKHLVETTVNTSTYKPNGITHGEWGSGLCRSRGY